MVWCDEDSADVLVAVASLRAVADLLAGDVRRRVPTARARQAIKDAMKALSDLSDVYYDETPKRPGL